MKQFLPLVFLLAVAGCGNDDNSEVGSKVSDFTVETLSVPVATASLHHKLGKVVLLDFWATWCGPCKQIMPVVEKIYEDHKAEGLEAMAISPEAREILAINEKKSPHTVPVYVDTSGSASVNLGAASLPTIVVVGKDGRIVYETHGINQATPEELSDAVVKALGTK